MKDDGLRAKGAGMMSDRISRELIAFADNHDRHSELSPPTFTAERLRRIAEAWTDLRAQLQQAETEYREMLDRATKKGDELRAAIDQRDERIASLERVRRTAIVLQRNNSNLDAWVELLEVLDDYRERWGR